MLDHAAVRPFRTDLAAQASTGLQNDDLGPLLQALPRGGETRDPAPDDRQPHAGTLGWYGHRGSLSKGSPVQA